MTDQPQPINDPIAALDQVIAGLPTLAKAYHRHYVSMLEARTAGASAISMRSVAMPLILRPSPDGICNLTTYRDSRAAWPSADSARDLPDLVSGASGPR